MRHDGTSQQDIPVDANIDMLGIKVSPSGAIDFLGVRIDTGEKVMGTVAAGSTEVEILSSTALDVEQVAAFTRIH